MFQNVKKSLILDRVYTTKLIVIFFAIAMTILTWIHPAIKVSNQTKIETIEQLPFVIAVDNSK